MASSSFMRWLLLALLASLLVSAYTVLPVAAVDDIDESEEEAAAGGDYESADGGGTEVVASGEDVEEAEEEVLLSSAPGVLTTAIFPRFLGKAPIVRAGQKAELLFGIENSGSGPLKITGVLSRLYVTYDHRIVAQNFTGELPSNITVVNATVPKGAQSSFAFHFTPFKLLQPMVFGFATTLFYELDGTPHASVLYNSTVEIVEPAGVITGEAVFLLLLGAGILALFGMWASTQLENLSKRAKRNKKQETGTKEEADAANNEWLQGTFFNSNQKSAKQVQQRKKR